MRLHNFTDEILFDTFPKTPRAFQKVFITYMQWIPSTKIADSYEFPTIYTSKSLATQIATYFKQIELKVMPAIVRLKPYEPHRIALSKGQHIEVLLCEGQNVSHNCMIAVRLQGHDLGPTKQILHFYAGNCTDVRSLMFNDQAIEWLSAGVNHLYMNMRHASEIETDREQDARKIVEFLKINSIESKIVIILPLFGCEDLIAFIARSLRKRVCLCESVHKYFVNLSGLEDFLDNFAKARVIVSACNDIVPIMSKVDPTTISVYITDTEAISEPDKRCYAFQYSPLPMPAELFLLASLLQGPSGMHRTNNRRIHSLPDYLSPFTAQSALSTPKRKPSCSEEVTSPESAPSNKGSSKVPKGSAKNSSPIPAARVASTVVAPRKRNIRYLDDDSDD